MNSLNTQETLIPLINVCRKIKGCNSSQLSQWVSAITLLFAKNTCHSFWRDVLVKVFMHSKIPSDILTQIELLVPDQSKLNTNQTIPTKKKLKTKQSQPTLTLIKIPKDLKIFIFNFLTINELIKTQQTCKCLNIASRHPNSLNYLNIKICRKIKRCNSSQLSQWLSAISLIFAKNNSHNLWINTLLKLFCSIHSKIASDLLTQIELLLPNENQLNINDTITKSDIKKDKNKEQTESMIFLKIPKDLKIYMFNFLGFYELIYVQKTCRCLNITSRNPNSLNSLYIGRWNNHYFHSYFSKIKSLSVYYDLANSLNQKWPQNLISLQLRRYSESLPFFKNLQRCSLRNIKLILIEHRKPTDDHLKYFITNNHFNFHNLKVLKLRRCYIDNLLLLTITKLINLEKLEIIRHHPESNFDSIINDKNTKMFNNVKIGPFQRLNNFIGRRICNLCPWIHYILRNDISKTVDISTEDGGDLFLSDTKTKTVRSVTTLKNIKSLKLRCENAVTMKLFLQNICKLIPLMNKTKLFSLDQLDLYFLVESLDYSDSPQHSIKLLDIVKIANGNILSYCDSSRLDLEVTVIQPLNTVDIDTDIEETVNYMINSNIKSFEQINITFEGCCSFNYRPNNDLLKFREEGIEYAKFIINAYNKWLKPFLIFTERIMKIIKMKKINILMFFDYNIYNIGKKWKEEIYPLFEQIIRKELSPLCEIQMNHSDLRVTFKNNIVL